MITNFLMNLSFREFLIWKIITISLLITISTEFLSYFNLISSMSIRIFWGFLIIFILFYIYFFKKKFSFSKKKNFFKRKFYFRINYYFNYFNINVIQFFNLSTKYLRCYGLPYAKDHALDSNGNINFYPTDDLRQLILAPFSEFIILHLYLFWPDFFSNFVHGFQCLFVLLQFLAFSGISGFKVSNFFSFILLYLTKVFYKVQAHKQIM